MRSSIRPNFSDSVREPLAMTSAYIFDDPEQARARFAGEQPGNVYTRFTNPNVEALEERIAVLEGGEECVAVSTGMACYNAIVMELTKPGDKVAISRGLFGSTTTLFKTYGPRLGLEVVEFDPDTGPSELMEEGDVRLVVLESPTNPTLQLADIAAYARTGARLGALLVVDNTISGPFSQRPLELGADLVVHSLAKMMDGHGRAGGGAIVGDSAVVHPLKNFRRTCGSSLSPFNAWLISTSLETLEMRSHHIGASAIKIVEFLQAQRLEVLHPWAETGDRSPLIERQITIAPGIVSFRCGGGRERAWAFLSALRTIGLGTNIGDGRSLATHPASTTHGRVAEAERVRAGITEDLVRISVGLEQPEIIIADIEAALLEGVRR